ncbi:MAG: twin-arginine translocation signal domain-containing protein [Proteobacteria bacterium]|nr:twin-arginine translocation signal domain-containing protein [Pseudomonadota bacterium]MBS0607933.1 twin-arginine translocation signal domain-containing protein [Pseudomonadota bacterium]
MRFISISQERRHDGLPAGKTPPLTRRHLLKGTGVLIGTLAAGSPLALLAPSTAWALELKTLTQVEGDTLLQMGRVLFPHPQLADAVYALLVKDLDAGAAADASAAQGLRTGIAALDHLAGGSFLKASAGRRLEAVKAMEGQAFFNTVRGKCVTSLYDNEMAYATFGYEGSAWEKGGYIMRGFQDLKWLPEPSAEASPPPFMG